MSHRQKWNCAFGQNMLETESDRARLLMGSWEWHGFEIQV